MFHNSHFVAPTRYEVLPQNILIFSLSRKRSGDARPFSVQIRHRRTYREARSEGAFILLFIDFQSASQFPSVRGPPEKHWSARKVCFQKIPDMRTVGWDGALPGSDVWDYPALPFSAAPDVPRG